MNSEKKKAAPPKLHKFMHPRNPYRTPPSFKDLAVKYPEFRAYCIYELNGKVRLNFKDPNAVRALTTCLLDQDFDLKVNMPDGRLVPTLPLRLNYLLWIEDLLTLSTYNCKQKCVIAGVDIGCGSSCIYPLLAAKKFGWCMIATEADQINYSSAENNVKNNSLEDHIIVKEVKESMIFKDILDDEKIVGDLISARQKLFMKRYTCADAEREEHSGEKLDNCVQPAMEEGKYLFDFTMCNPPFFSSEEETDSMSKSKRNRSEPSSVATGAIQETVTEGGEVAFISQMIDESVMLKGKVRIFTTMIGTKAHIKPAKDKLMSVKPSHTSLVEFCQGRTMRWGIAWTFDASFHLQNIMSKKQMVEAKPFTIMIPRSLMTVYTVQAAWTKVNKWLHQLKINVQVFKNTKYFVGANIKAFKLTWLHQRRKRREQQRKEAKVDKNGENMSEDKEECQTTEDRTSLKRIAAHDSCVKFLGKKQKTEENDPIQATSSNANEILSKEEQMTSEQLISKESVSEVSVTKDNMETSQQESFKGLECILKAKLQVKQFGSLVSLEALYLRGSLGKDGLNQLVQYMRNRLSNPQLE